MSLTGKKIVLLITGSISAYKMANVASMLVKRGCDVHVAMTVNATEFITPVTFETLTKNPCLTDTFYQSRPVDIHHITLGQSADLIMVAPASANILAKMATGIADDLVSSILVAANVPVLVSPAMNTVMYQNAIVQDNIRKLKRYGYQFIEPAVGHLACDAVGIGKLPSEEELIKAIENTLAKKEEKAAFRKILITAGPTRENLDPVRFITNHSTGKMGYAIAEAAKNMGAEVTLVSGPVELPAPEGVRVVQVTSAKEMFDAVMQEKDDQDAFVLTAAVADYRPKHIAGQKIKKQDGEMMLELERTDDILKKLGETKMKTQILCGFSMETEQVLEHSREKRKKKHADLIAANCLFEKGAGFGTDTNHLTLIGKDFEKDLGMLSKRECATEILRIINQLYIAKNE